MYSFYLPLLEKGLPPIFFKTTLYINQGIPKVNLIGNVQPSLKRQVIKINSTLKHLKLLRFKTILIEMEDIGVQYTNSLYINIFLSILIPILKRQIKLKPTNVTPLVFIEPFIYKNVYLLSHGSILTNITHSETLKSNIEPVISNKQPVTILNITNIYDPIASTIFYQEKDVKILEINKISFQSFILLNLSSTPDIKISSDSLIKLELCPKKISTTQAPSYKHEIPLQHYVKTIKQATSDFLVHQNLLANGLVLEVNTKYVPNIPTTYLSLEVFNIPYPMMFQVTNLLTWSSYRKLLSTPIRNKSLIIHLPPCKCGNFLSPHGRCLCTTSSLLSYYNKNILPFLNISPCIGIIVNNDISYILTQKQSLKVYTHNP